MSPGKFGHGSHFLHGYKSLISRRYIHIFHFHEEITEILCQNGKVTGVATDKNRYDAATVIDAAGPFSPELCKTANIDIPITPDSHEGAITEPVQPFFECMVVDIRPAAGSKNYYFYQNKQGQVISAWKLTCLVRSIWNVTAKPLKT